MSDKDKLADALNAMMGGQSEPEHQEEVEHEAPVEPPPAETARPAPVAPKVKAAAPTVPAPAQPPQATRAARPVAPAIASPPATAARSSRPVAPTIASPSPEAPAVAPVGQPTARPSAPARPAAPPAAATINYAPRKVATKKGSKAGTVQFRQTLIPPCLVVGLSFLLLAIGFFLQPSTAALRHASLIIPIGLGLMGAALLAVGILNMLMVKGELERQKQPS